MNARIPASALQPTASKVASVFTSGNSQAVRIPKEFQLKTKQVTIVQRGDELVLKPKYKTFGELLANLPKMTAKEAAQWDKAMEAIQEIRKEPAQERDWDQLFGPDESALRKTTPRATAEKAKA
ncbi:MAG: AbrB/MazE/SpoVT family DNA-binding domain-containing protein [Burkholderiaceae bacterium]